MSLGAREEEGHAREGEERGRGVPRSEEERWERHQELYPGEPLPPRGYGLRGIGDDAGSNMTPIIISGIFGLVSTLILAAAILRSDRRSRNYAV
jgi:hypothetical protein